MIKVVIVDDQNTVRSYLNAYLGEISQISVVGLANNGKEAIDLVEKHLPDLVLMDLEMPVMNGIEATRIISERFNRTKILLLTSKEKKQLLNLALKAGARGYILKTARSNDLDKIICLAIQGYLQFGPIGEQHYSQTAISPNSHRAIKSSALVNSDIYEVMSYVSQNILDIKETIELQHDKIDKLSNLYSYKQQRKRQNYLIQRKSPNFSLNISYKSKKNLTSFSQQNFLFVSGFLLGITTFAILLIVLKITS